MVTAKAITIIKIAKIVRRVRLAAEAADRIRVSVQRIIDAQTEMHNRRERIDNVGKLVLAIVNNPVTQAWKATAEGELFVQRMQDARRDIESLANVISRFVEVLRSSAEEFRRAQEKIVAMAGDLP